MLEKDRKWVLYRRTDRGGYGEVKYFVDSKYGFEEFRKKDTGWLREVLAESENKSVVEAMWKLLHEEN